MLGRLWLAVELLGCVGEVVVSRWVGVLGRFTVVVGGLTGCVGEVDSCRG